MRISCWLNIVVWALAVTTTVATASPEALRGRVEAAEGGERDLPLRSIRALQRFYEARDYRAVWTDDAARRAALVRTIEASAAQGLDPAHYHLAALRAWQAETPTDDADRVDLELLASDAWMQLGGHYAEGRVDPLSLNPQWHATRHDFDGARALEAALEDGDPAAYLERLLPQQAGYRQLVDLLAGYRAGTDWPAMPEGPTLEPGARDPRVAALRRRLAAAGDLAQATGADDEAFDPKLEAAVRAFQARHGLAADGVVGTETLAALNVPRAERTDQIRANLERWRWLPPALGRRHIRVNIADYRLEAWEEGRPVLSMKTIVGRSYRRTPVFSGEMTYLVLNPTWKVPENIAVRDKLPQIRQDPGYLERLGFEVWRGSERVDPATVDWEALGPGRFPYRLTQRPGPNNALGRVKFMFPNPFNVYLHDTPDRHLFERDRRDFSSGCIRLEKPLELIDWVLIETPGWDPARTRAALAAGDELVVALPAPIPVHLDYWTAWIAPDGRPQFREDVYRRDARVVAALDLGP